MQNALLLLSNPHSRRAAAALGRRRFVVALSSRSSASRFFPSRHQSRRRQPGALASRKREHHHHHHQSLTSTRRLWCPVVGRRSVRTSALPVAGPPTTTTTAITTTTTTTTLQATQPAVMVSVAWVIGAASVVDFGIQLVGWAISSALKTEKYYDLCGSGAFAAVAVSTWASGEGFGVPRATWATCAVVAWAVRLGAFLVTRVHKDGGDARFDGIKEDPKTFGIYWFVQGVWVLVTTMPVILINANAATQGPWRALDWIGFVIFAAGFTIETIADRQKRSFKADAKNKGRYIDSGLWSISRHPNYFGEITLWTGMSLVGLSGVAKYGPGEIIGCVLSPLMVAFLITQLSGIPLLEKSADERWGKEEAYQKYKRETPVLVPFFK